MAENKVTRKLTTILAADVEGYTRLMRADEDPYLASDQFCTDRSVHTI